jgi:hypothetical protein
LCGAWRYSGSLSSGPIAASCGFGFKAIMVLMS